MNRLKRGKSTSCHKLTLAINASTLNSFCNSFMTRVALKAQSFCRYIVKFLESTPGGSMKISVTEPLHRSLERS